MVCLYHGDYGPADPAFDLGSASHFGMRGWMVDATLLKNARNIGEAQAIERHLIRGESVSWCDYAAAFLFVVLPYLIFKIKARAKITLGAPTGAIDGRQGLTD